MAALWTLARSLGRLRRHAGRLRRQAGRLRRCAAGVSAIEFAFGVPLMLLIMMGGVDVTRYVMATQRVERVAQTIGQMISQNSTGTVTWTDLQFYHDSAAVIFPDMLADAASQGIAWPNDIAITMSSLQFTTVPPLCTSGCIYVPAVVWSGGPGKRSCIVPQLSASDTASPSALTLPADAYGPGSIIVIDVSYKFRPTLSGSILKPVTIARSYYVAPRNVALVKYQVIAGDNGIAAECPLFP